MKKRTIALNLRSYGYTKLYLFTQGIHDNLQRLSASFPSPVPSLAVCQADIEEMIAAIARWGDDGNRGSTKDKMAVLLLRDTLREHLKSYARYVMVTQPENEVLWAEVGFGFKKLPAKTEIVSMITGLHQFFARNIPQGNLKLKWYRPLEVASTTSITYIVMRSADTAFSNASIINMVVNKASYIDTPPKAGVVYYYWIVPVSTAGKGVASKACPAFARPV